jgi:WD40 repeat protein
LHHARTVLKAVFSPDSQLVATGSLDGTVRIWNARTGQPVTAPIVHEFAVSQVCFSPEGRRLLSSSWAAKSRLWDVQTGLPLTEWIDAGGFGFSSRFDEFGQRVVSGAQSGLVQIWDTPTLPLPVPAWFIGLVEAVAGTRYSEDGNVELVPREELDKLRQRLTPENRQGFYGGVGLWLLR